MKLLSIFKDHPYVTANLLAEKSKLIKMGVVLFAQAMLALLMPLPIRFVLDHILVPGQAETMTKVNLWFWGAESSQYRLLIIMSVLLLTMTVLTAILDFLEEIFTSQAIASLTNRVRGDLFQQLLTRKQSFIDSKRKIDLMGRLSGDVSNLEIPIAAGMISLVRAIPTIFFIVGVILWVNWKFSIFVLMVLPTLYFLATWLSKKIRAQEKIMRSKTVIMDQDMHQALNSMSLIKSLTGEEEAFEQISRRQSEVATAFRNSRKAYAYFNSSLAGTRNVVRALFVLIGGTAVLSGFLTIGTLFLFVSYLEALNRPINDISTLISRLSKALVSIERVEALHKELLGYPEESGFSRLNKVLAMLQFEKVDFKYAESGPLFKNLSLDLEPGQFVALVGTSGVGKTSFLKLLNRLQDPTAGRILLAGQDIKDFDIHDLRKFICVVGQEPLFFAASVRENLLMALPKDKKDEELWEVLEKTNSTEFVKAMPAALNTHIGEAGIQISGGQAKRLSLARGFLRENQASIFVFDEPTSGLDPISAQKIISSLQGLADRSGLVMWTTHRLEEAKLADQVLYFSSEGPILATHEDLYTKNQSYRTLIES